MLSIRKLLIIIKRELVRSILCVQIGFLYWHYVLIMLCSSVWIICGWHNNGANVLRCNEMFPQAVYRANVNILLPDLRISPFRIPVMQIKYIQNTYTHTDFVCLFAGIHNMPHFSRRKGILLRSKFSHQLWFHWITFFATKKFEISWLK